jgi:hypothetical protein
VTTAIPPLRWESDRTVIARGKSLREFGRSSLITAPWSMTELFYSSFLFVKIRVIRRYLVCVIHGCLLCLILISSREAEAGGGPSYKCLMRTPADLVTAEGVRLEKGQYELEIKPEVAGSYLLSFSSDGHVKAVVKSVRRSDAALSSAVIPVTGTHYLRTSDEPLLTGEERRFSKTGRAQYEEESRDWKATLRVYKAPPDAVFFVLQVRGIHRQWTHVGFQLILGHN